MKLFLSKSLRMYLEQPGLFNIRSVTHVRLVKLSYVNLNKIFASHPVLLHQVEKIANAMMTEMVKQKTKSDT